MQIVARKSFSFSSLQQ